jgi:hypothetical protein
MTRMLTSRKLLDIELSCGSGQSREVDNRRGASTVLPSLPGDDMKSMNLVDLMKTSRAYHDRQRV